MLPSNSQGGQQLLAQFTNAPVSGDIRNLEALSRKGLLAWAVKVVAADGVIDPRERELLQSLATKCNVETSHVDTMISLALSGRLGVPDPPNRQAAQVWLEAMAACALADGQVQPPEAALITRAGMRFGFTPTQVNQILREQYAQQLANAKSELRTSRQQPS
jgi:tellurite resistance protein